ncbi:hypothetical protein V8G69_07655 [Gaetbulibacter sp. M235]|uniref:hypothetical protein n=1 Tax=Gaetbulibacter sp. M235 TaxID=3126510 RepID=UPI00374F9F19
MTELTKNKTKEIKLYSSKAISGATFLGGPLAAGYLISENFKALNKPDDGRKSLIIGIITTIVLFGGIFMLPESIIDKIPRQIIPLIYTGIIWGIVEWKQGDILKVHKENGNSFFSGWRAAGVGFISLVIIGIGIFGYAFLSTDDEIYEQYDSELAVFSKNENESLVFYNHIDSKPKFALINELDNDVIPKWKENLKIIERTNQMENLPNELLKQNEILLKYCELRIKGFELFKKAISEDTDKYSIELNRIHSEIDKQLKKLN